MEMKDSGLSFITRYMHTSLDKRGTCIQITIFLISRPSAVVRQVQDHFFSAIPHVFLFQPFLLCLSVKLFNRIIESAAFNACFVNAVINNACGSFHL